MPKITKSAGLLMFRRTLGELEVFLVHPGGPFFKHKDAGVWTIPKGLIGVTEGGQQETPLEAARREFQEETGFAPGDSLIDLGSVRMKGGKIVQAWAFEGSADPARMRSSTFPLEWPPQSGQIAEVPEADRGAFFSIPDALEKIVQAQAEFLDRLREKAG